MNLMLINVSTRKLRRAVRLPEGDLPVITGDGTSKSAASRRCVALSAERLAAWLFPGRDRTLPVVRQARESASVRLRRTDPGDCPPDWNGRVSKVCGGFH